MRRTLFNLSVALLAFGLGSLVVSSLYRKAEEQTIHSEEGEIAAETKIEEKIGKGSATGYRSKQSNEPVYIPKLHRATCASKNLLPVWNELLKDKEFQEQSKKFYREADCKDMFEIQNIDLNNDGRREFILWGKNGNLCGATGNCEMWIYEKKNGKYKQLLHSNGYSDGEEKWFEVNKVTSNGYRNILLKGHASGYETTEQHYEFDGKKYKETKCLFLSYYPDENNPSVRTCKKVWKQ